ncbi:hypothetical protein Tco_0179618 [Tanacetum coccineum]
MQVQSTLYNGHEIVKTNHAPAVVHDSEDTIELAEINRNKMLEKMKIPQYVEKKIKIAPLDYLKENYLETFTPQRQLSVKQIFWCFVPKPISEMTVYPPNTPARLVPRVLPIKSQKGKGGFEQTNECYLSEVIAFFKTVKEHFEGTQTALVKEVKEIKEIFKQIEAEVEQNAMDKKCAKIERKNLLIDNENLIVDCLSNELLYSVMNVVNIVSRFSEMHDAYIVEQARNVDLETEISKLKHKIQKDDHSEMIKHFSNLEVDHLNLQLKYQHLKDRYGNNKSQTSRDVPEFDSFFEINKLKEQLQGKDNTIRKLKVKISRMNKKRSEVDLILDFKALDSQNKELIKHVTALQEQNERFKAENEKAQLKGKMKCVTMDTVNPKVLAPGMYAIDVEPIPPNNRNNREVHLDYLKHLKESVETLREIVEEARIKPPLDNALKNACFYTKRS